MQRALIGCLLVLITVYAPPAQADERTPEVNDIWSETTQTYVAQIDMVKDLMDADVIVFGEVHGEKAHQSRIAHVVRALGAKRSDLTLVLEMLDTSQNTLLAAYQKENPESLDGLDLTLRWKDSGWPDYRLYKPILDAAHISKWRILGGDLPRGVDLELPTKPSTSHDTLQGVRTSWVSTLQEAHCDTLNEEDALKKAAQQILRDHSMASTLKNNAPAVMVTGLAHARRDRGMALYLKKDFKVVTIGLFKLKPNEPPSTYRATFSHTPDVHQFDYLWFTPPATKPSVCDRLRAKGLVK